MSELSIWKIGEGMEGDLAGENAKVG